VVQALVGNGQCNSTGDGGSALNATLNAPRGVTVDAAGTVYVAENLGSRVSVWRTGGRCHEPHHTCAPSQSSQVRAVRWAASCESLLPTASPSRTATPSNTASSSNTPTPSITPSPSPASLCNVRLVAGNGSDLQPLEGAQAVSSGLGNVHGLVANGSLLYVTDRLHLKVRRIDLRTGAITTFLGNGGSTGTVAGELATQAPLGILNQGAILPNGDLAIAATGRCLVVGVSQVRWAARAGGRRCACAPS
jgi:hypothetical protein